jgi:hypothetical protein
MTIPSNHCYVPDPYNRISAEGQLKAAASGKYGLQGADRREQVAGLLLPAGGGPLLVGLFRRTVRTFIEI